MKVFLNALLTLSLAALLQAQGFVAVVFETDQPLTTGCTGGAGIPDGGMYYLHQDLDGDGAELTDPQATLCYAPPECLTGGESGSLNRNALPMNGEAMLGVAGTFYPEYAFISQSTLPAVNRFFIKVWYDTPGTRTVWLSNVFSPAVGLSDIELTSWTCEELVTMEVLDPDGSEQWLTPLTHMVRWTSPAESPVRISLNRNYPSGLWETLVNSTANDGEEAVSISAPPSEHCRIRISVLEGDFEGAANDSDADFALVAGAGGYLALVRPTEPDVALDSWNAGRLSCAEFVESVQLKNFGAAAIEVAHAWEPPSAAFTYSTTCPPTIELDPGQVHGCRVVLGFLPAEEGTLRDSLRIPSNAANAVDGLVRVPLMGTLAYGTPEPPRIAIRALGNDIRLTWPAVTRSVDGCDITVTGYLVFQAVLWNGTYFYLSAPDQPVYVHPRAIATGNRRYYKVLAYTGPRGAMQGLEAGMSLEEVKRQMRERVSEIEP